MVDVQRRDDGKWEAKRENSERASALYTTQSAAAEEGKRIAKSAGLGQLRIRGRDGKIRTEHTHGADPATKQG